MEIANRFGKLSLKNGKSLLKLASGAAFAVLVYLVVLWAAELFFGMFAKAGLEYEALVLLFTVIFLVLLFSSINSTIKVLYYKGDNEILMRFPVTGSEVFWAKTMFLLLSQIFMTAVILTPFLIAYGRVVQVPVQYYLSIPFVIFFMVFIPFFISNVLAIPFMHLSNKIRNKFAFIIICLAVFITLLFFVYTLLFEKAVLYLRNDKVFSVFDSDTVLVIRDLIKYFIPTKYFAGMMLGQFEVNMVINREPVTVLSGESRVLSFSVFTVILELAMIGTYFVIKKLYQKTLLANVEIEGSAFTRKTKNKRRRVFSALLYKEFIQVFRSVNYSFQYFVLACAMPVMVFFCNRIAFAIGKDDIGNRIIPGLTLLVMLIFNTVIISFSATSVTREGNNFYHTKVMPVSVRMQLLVKFTMYIIVSFAANTITILIIIFSKQMVETGEGYEFTKPLLIYAVVTMLSIGLTLLSMRYDVKKPRFNLNGEGELVSNNANTTKSVTVGLLIAMVFGILGMIIPYFIAGIGTTIMFILLLALSGLFFIYAFLRYCVRLTKTYNGIV